ncbi:unnamed protein product, partial [Rotaria sp. Silwood1]
YIQNQPSNRQFPPSTRLNPPSNGVYVSKPSRQYEQYPVAVPVHQHEYRNNYAPPPPSNKHHHKNRNITSNGVIDQCLPPDQEKSHKKHPKEPSQNQSPILENQSKQDEIIPNQEEQYQSMENTTHDSKSQDNTNDIDEQQNNNSEEKKNRKSRSKKKHQHDHLEHNNGDNTHIQQQTNFLGELPPHLKVHQQPLYNSYNQVYEESILRGDLYQKQAKRSTRLPPEAKQKLLPHEDDKKNPYPLVGYFPQSHIDIQPLLNPYQSYNVRSNFYGQTVPYNSRQAWTNMNGMNISDEQKIDSLRNHIHTLEHELHRLQKKLYKATLQYNETSNKQNDNNHKQRRSKRDIIPSPRETPVIVELNNIHNQNGHEPSSLSKKKRNQIENDQNLQQEQNFIQQPNEIFEQNITLINNSVRNQSPNKKEIDSHESTNSNDNPILENEGKISSIIKNSREETAARLAHAAAAHVNARQQYPPPPPPKQQNGILPKQEQQQIRGQVQFLPVNGTIHQLNDSQQRNMTNITYNPSNNNEILNNKNNNEAYPHMRTVEKILDAFERVYMKDRTSAITPVKVKYIPELHESNWPAQRNKNNNNQYRSESQISQSSSSSTWSNTSDELSSGDLQQIQVINRNGMKSFRYP